MEKNIFTITVFSLLFTSCFCPKPIVEEVPSVKEVTIKKSLTPPKPSFYSDILSENLSLNIDGKTLPLTLITFTHTESDLIGKKRIFELYGNWEKAMGLPTSKYPLLMWKNIPLLDNDYKMMTIIADGKLINNINQISFFVYDSKTKENLLANNSPYKEPIIKKLTQLLETNDPKNKAFEKKFWKDFYFIDIYEGS